MNAEVDNGFMVAGKGTAPADNAGNDADGFNAADWVDCPELDVDGDSDGLKAVDWVDCPELDVDDDADGLKTVDWSDCPEVDVADEDVEEEEPAAAEGGGAPHPLSQPAAPPLPLMGVAEMVIELMPLAVPVTVLLFGWFGGAWLE